MIFAATYFLAEDYNYCVSRRSLIKTIKKTPQQNTEMKTTLNIFLPNCLLDLVSYICEK